MELISKQMFITPAQDRVIKYLAEQQKVTEAEILHQALDLLLAREGWEGIEDEDPFDELTGLFE